MKTPFAYALRSSVALLVLAAACSSPSSTPPEPLHDEPGPLKAGAGQAVIQLPVGHSTAGYAQSEFMGMPQPKDDPGSPYTGIFASTRGMQSAPAAKVVVIENGHSRLFIAKIDAVGISEILVERVTRMAKEKLGEDIAGQIILNATHTHDAGSRFLKYSVGADMFEAYTDGRRNALAHGFDIYSQESTDRVSSAVIEAMRQALATERPAKFGYGKGETRLAAHDRRCENDELSGTSDFIDSTVTVMRLDDAATGDPIAVMFNYPMHGIFYDFGNWHLSVDAPGHSEYKVEEMFEKPVVAMYLQGSAGNVSPSGGGSEGSQAMQHAGYMLAQEVMRVYGTIQTIDTASVQARSRWIPISHDILGYGKGEFYRDGAGLCFQLYGKLCPKYPAVQLTPEDVIDPALNLCLAKVLEDEGKYHTMVSTARIGDLAFMAMPGEPVTAVGLEMKARGTALGFKDVVVLGYAQDHNGYVLLAEDWLRGGYEPTISFWGWKFGAYAIDQVADLLQEMKTGQAPKKRSEPVKVPDLTPEQYTPIVPTNSSQTPDVVLDVPAEVERTEAIRFAFYGGDPGLGHPEVRLQKKNEDGSFSDVLKNGWLPVSNLRGYDYALFYTVTPTFKEAPTATAREHRWEYVYESPIDLALGSYRFHFTGKAKVNGTEQPVDLATSAFELKPSSRLTFDAKAIVADGKVVVDATALYPQEEAKNVDAKWPFNSWQVEHFRLLVPRYSGHFAPVLEVGTAGAATAHVQNGMGEGTDVAIPFTFVSRSVDEKQERYNVGEGPGLHGEWTITDGSTVPSEITVPAGSFTDAWGNTNAEVKVPVTAANE